MTGRQGREPDPYQVLGVGPGASGAEIARAYRRLARGLHPDSRPAGAEAADRFRAVSDAYALLSDPARRAAWDQRHPASQPAARPGSWRPAPGPPLRAGPVHIQPPPAAARTAGPPPGDDLGELELLLARLIRGLRSWPW